MKDPATKTPFCGTGASSTAPDNNVDVGTCGKCQIQAWGGGGESEITVANGGSGVPGSGDDTSCGRGMVCCENGKCAAEHLLC